MDNKRDKVLQNILNGSDNDFDPWNSQDNDSLRDTKYDKREFEFSE